MMGGFSARHLIRCHFAICHFLGLHRAQCRPGWDRVTVIGPKRRCLFWLPPREGIEIIPQPSIKPLGHGGAVLAPFNLAQPFRQRGFHRIEEPGAELGIRRMRVRQAFEIPRLARLMDPVNLCPGHGARGVAINVRHRGSLGGIGAKERLASLARVFEFLRRPR